MVSTDMAIEAPEATSENIHTTGACHVRVAWLFTTKKQRYSTSEAAFSSPVISSNKFPIVASVICVVDRYLPREPAAVPAVESPAEPVRTEKRNCMSEATIAMMVSFFTMY